MGVHNFTDYQSVSDVILSYFIYYEDQEIPRLRAKYTSRITTFHEPTASTYVQGALQGASGIAADAHVCSATSAFYEKQTCSNWGISTTLTSRQKSVTVYPDFLTHGTMEHGVFTFAPLNPHISEK